MVNDAGELEPDMTVPVFRGDVRFPVRQQHQVVGEGEIWYGEAGELEVRLFRPQHDLDNDCGHDQEDSRDDGRHEGARGEGREPLPLRFLLAVWSLRRGIGSVAV